MSVSGTKEILESIERRNDYTGRGPKKNEFAGQRKDISPVLAHRKNQYENLILVKDGELAIKDEKISVLIGEVAALQKQLAEANKEIENLKKKSIVTGRQAQEAVTKLLRSRIDAGDEEFKNMSFRVVGEMRSRGFIDFSKIVDASEWLMDSLVAHTPAETMSFLRRKVREDQIELAPVELALIELISWQSGKFLGEEVVDEAKALA